MKIYTKTGDKGKTSLIFGERVSKNDIRVEAYGTCDEANSMIGLGVSLLPQEEWAKKATNVMQRVQTVLFHVGAELATPSGKEVSWKLKEEDIHFLEKTIDSWQDGLKPLKQFILPGGSPSGSAFHTARTIARRAERLAVGVEGVNPLVLSYLNRLSDFLFVAARYANDQMKVHEPVLHEENS
ncbi:cob(I)yrinic acid a,c-diamide adenosyltransferase [Fictibacillus nanhaiensis]|uniref:cob(I)yrinic acid a,c-diamide adenosyltransferase n=1 Tax=Fictibacillus nanhaiensis TaxID=742169 RepID=UPI001C94A5EC|nr:cob(I)yrinic acid a,c-diamide adenosyltransferase [Fictibacillus nanhaiensis]MBY6038416.1 cob(I)yrinic acid a,c-diamide adenosyltransferase [Fictibacillus nanhaiensis]